MSHPDEISKYPKSLREHFRSLTPEEALYVYKAEVYSVYDGDTLRAHIDLGFGVLLKKQSIRWVGIDTPEVRGETREEGLKVRDYVRDFIPIGSEICIQTKKDKSGKYGRWLGIIWVKKEDEWINVNKHLLDNGMAVIEEY